MNDRFGLSWRPQLAAGIFAHLEEIDVVEVIAEDYFDASRDRVAMLRTLAVQVPVELHGVSQGLASTVLAEQTRLAKMARLVDTVRPESWSEHLAFVRGGGIEIGHMAAPPRNAATVEGTCRNLELARRVVGMMPRMENVATLIDPPGSVTTEAEWLGSVTQESSCGIVLDLHNLHANAMNFGFDPIAFLDSIPGKRIASVHIAGGIMLESGRILDDHLHEVGEPVYRLLGEVAARAPQPLTVILERDGRFPPVDQLLMEIRTARAVVAEGRKRLAA
jgi:uncharacterized protein (UPF0276 family)